MRVVYMLFFSLALLFSCKDSFHYSQRRFGKNFYVHAYGPDPSAGIHKSSVPFQNEVISPNVIPPEISELSASVILPRNIVTSPETRNPKPETLSSDTIPSPDLDKKVKLNRQEKVSFALITTGTVFLMIALGLLVFILVGLVSGGAVASSVWYFIGGTALIGYLLREWGIQRKS